tara:strand:+ start:307 stop:1503 length:1197 start_codon:yes stop_codon:yes gene_type:complete
MDCIIMSSITGLKRGAFTSIDNSGEFRLDTNLDTGTAGEVITSGGPNQPATWGPNAVAVPNALTMGLNVNLTSGNPSWDGSVAETLNSIDTNTLYYAGAGLGLVGVIFNTNNDGTTINNSGGTGTQNQVLKVPNDLTAGTNIQFVGSSGPTASYNGDDATTINNTQTDTTYQGGANITIDTTTNPDTIDLDAALTGMTGITYTGSGGNNLTGAGMPGSGTTCTYLDLISATNIFPTLYPNSVVPYLDVAYYDPTVYTSQALTTSYVQIFSGLMTLTFTCMPGRSLAEVELKVINGGGSANRWIYLGLLDGAGTTEWSASAATGGGSATTTSTTERVVHYKDETDYDYVTMSWVLTGLTPGNTYIVNPSAKTSSTTNYIYAGGAPGWVYPCCISRVTQL